MRIKQIDALRGIAALLVALFHLTGNTGLSSKTSSLGSYGWVGVQIFFVISGFVLPYSMHKLDYSINDLNTFMKKRLLRIYPSYIFAILITITLAYISGRATIPLKDGLSHIFLFTELLGFKTYNPVIWTLLIEFQFYILIGITYSLIIRNNLSICFLVFLSIISRWFPYSTIFYWFPYFALGILIFNKFITGLTTINYLASTTVLLFLIWLYFGIPHLIASIFTILFIFFIRIEGKGILQKALLWLGTISYSLYLVHWEIGRLFVVVSKRINILENSEISRVLIGLSASIIAGYIVYLVIEKSSIKLSHKIKYKNRIPNTHKQTA